jgi:outer membrane protein insertion porin family
MAMLSTRKASAIHASPGFSHFAVFLILGAILAAQPSSGQEGAMLREIVVIGNRAIPAATILAWIESRPGGIFRRSDIARIDSGLADAGFPLGRVDSVRLRQADGSRSSDLLLYIREGKPARFAGIKLEGVRILDAVSLLSLSGLGAGEPFTARALERGIVVLLKQYESVGYPFAKVEIQEIRFTESPTHEETNLTLRVEEGTAARISALSVEGNTTTRASVIERAAHFTPGDLYSGELPAKIKLRLERLQLFSSVSMPELFVGRDRSVGLLVKVTEGSPNRFDGILGYVPSGTSGGSGYVTGFVDVQFRNLFGTARQLSARWNRESHTSQEIALKYREPWIASLPVSAEGGYGQRKQDSTYVRESYDVALETTVAEALTIGFVAAGRKVTPTAGFGQTVVGRSSTLSAGATVSYDSRDDRVTPTSGLRYGTEYRTGRKEILTAVQGRKTEQSSTQFLSFDLEYYLTPIRNQALAVLVSARDYRSSAVDVGDLFRLGGANTLRGYREGQFLGSTIAWANLEYRLLTGQRSFAFAFLDLGYAATPVRPEAGLTGDEFRRIGYGAGARVDTPLGLIGVSLAFGKGDTFSSGKLHLRLVNEF